MQRTNLYIVFVTRIMLITTIFDSKMFSLRGGQKALFSRVCVHVFQTFPFTLSLFQKEWQDYALNIVT